MRYIEILIDRDLEADALAVLDDEDIDYVVTDERRADDDASLIRFPLPTAAVGDVLTALHDAGLPEDAYTIITGAEAVTTPNFDELEDRYATSDRETDDTIAPEEIRARALDAKPNVTAYVLLTLFSTVIAVVGLLRNSPLAVAGAMVVSPFVGAILATTVGTVTADWKLTADGIRAQLLGIALAIIGAALFTALLKALYVLPPGLDITEIDQIGSIVSPSLVSLALALAAGAAGALALATALPVALAGVAIAIALIPAAAAVGVGIALGVPGVAIGAFTLLAMNVVSINLAAALVFRTLGYRAEEGSVRELFTPSPRRLLALVAVAVIVVAFVIGAAIPTYQQVVLERTVNRQVQDVIARQQYDDLTITSVEMGYGASPLSHADTTVTVTVSRRSNRSYPHLAATLQRQVTANTRRNVSIRVRFRDYQEPPSKKNRGDLEPVRRGAVQASKAP